MISASFVRRDTDRNAWLRLLRATRLIENLMRERFQARFSVMLPHFEVLAALQRHSEGMLMCEMSHFLMVSNDNVSGIIDRPVADGLVVCEQRNGDRRIQIVRLTGKGKMAFREMAATHENWIDGLLKELTARGADNLSAMLKSFRSNWEGQICWRFRVKVTGPIMSSERE